MPTHFNKFYISVKNTFLWANIPLWRICLQK